MRYSRTRRWSGVHGGAFFDGDLVSGRDTSDRDTNDNKAVCGCLCFRQSERTVELGNAILAR